MTNAISNKIKYLTCVNIVTIYVRNPTLNINICHENSHALISKLACKEFHFCFSFPPIQLRYGTKVGHMFVRHTC